MFLKCKCSVPETQQTALLFPRLPLFVCNHHFTPPRFSFGSTYYHTAQVFARLRRFFLLPSLPTRLQQQQQQKKKTVLILQTLLSVRAVHQITVKFKKSWSSPPFVALASPSYCPNRTSCPWCRKDPTTERKQEVRERTLRFENAVDRRCFDCRRRRRRTRHIWSGVR